MTSRQILAHRVQGEGEPILLLNGGMMSYAAWEPISGRLAQHHRLVLCDLRGQLLSPGPAPGDLAGNVADLTALLDHLEIESVHVLGASYGGEIGLLMAALEPSRVRSLVAVTVTDYATEAIRGGSAELRELLAAGTDAESRGRFHDRLAAEVYSDAFQERFGDALAARRELVAALPDAWFADLEGILNAAEALDLRPYLGSIRAPTLIVIAADDQIMPIERSQALAAAISGAEVRTHETAGHALVVEDPDWLVQVTLEFLSRRSGASPRDTAAH